MKGDIVENIEDIGLKIASSKKIYDYEGGILKSKTSIFQFNGEVYEHIINIIYDDYADIADDKETKEDIFYLTSFGFGVAIPDKMDIEYHEEYDEEGNLLSKTFIHYGEAQGNCWNKVLKRQEIAEYIPNNPNFRAFGENFLKILNFSLNENLTKTYKEISDGILQNR